MAKKRWLEKDTAKNGPLTLFDFSSIHDQVDAAMVCETITKDGWRISDDGVIHGNSSAKFVLVRTPIDYHQLVSQNNDDVETKPFLEDIDQIVAAAQREEEEEIRLRQQEEQGIIEENDKDSQKEASSSHNNKFIPFVRWMGNIDTQITKEQEERNIKRTGFCAIRSPEFTPFPANLDGRYNGIEIMCRSDGRPYSVNLHLETFIPDDIYQCFINIPPTIDENNITNNANKNIVQQRTTSTITGGGQETMIVEQQQPKQTEEEEQQLRFDKVVLLFRDFIVTSKGRLRATHRELDTNIKIESIGFTLMDGCDGNFQFDLAHIRAVNFDERGVIGEAD